MSRFREALIAAGLACLIAAPAQAEKLGLGRPALPEEVAAWDVNVQPDGDGLPPGGMSVEEGEMVFIEKCSACHGEFAEGVGAWPPLAGGRGTLTNARPVKTVGSYWPYVSTVWDYVHRSMPFGDAQTVTADETYGIVAYILYSEGLVEEDFTLTNENFTEVRLPNEDGFYVDDREETEFPVFTAEACMADCKETVEITRKASDLKVTPVNEAGKPAGTIPSVLAAADAAMAAPAGDAAAQEQAAEEPQAAAAEQVAATDAPAEPAAADAAAPDPALAAAGETVFKKCQACHKLGEDAKDGAGPVLNGILGASAAHSEGFRYSPAAEEAAAGGLVWTPENLDAFLADPRGFLKGTRMSFRGLPDAGDRAAVIAYLATFPDP